MTQYAKKRLAATITAALIYTTLGGVSALAAPATNPAGDGLGVAIGTGSSAPKVENVAIGQGAGIGYSNGASAATGDVAIGNGANINNYASQGGSIAIGKNAHIENMAGGGEASFAFGQTTYSGSWFSSARIPADPTKVVGSVAIGDNTFARTGSTMVGSHNYNGALGDTTVNSASTRTDALGVYATTVGANSFSNGAFTTSTGSYNIISSDYTGGRLSNATKNLGATINGSLNSVESKTGSYYSGIANTITGVANRTANSNGSLIFGAGNEITNSYTSLSATPTDGGASAKDFADSLRTSIRASNSGGSTMAFGGGNRADYTLRTALVGVNNTVTGTSGAASANNSITGFHNTATNVNHVTVTGSENTISDTNHAVVIGDNRTLQGANNSVILGSHDTGSTTNVSDAVAIGRNTNVTQAGGVAIGSGSIASVGAGAVGYDPSTHTASTNTTSVWKATDAAVSVGDGTTRTRQITSVAAGTNDTDAVNVAQLKQAIGNNNNINSAVINKLGDKVNRVGAGAAALAALHPLDFDPDDKWDFAAGYGNYNSANAVAVGAYYRPNEDVMFSVGGSFGAGENLVNAGVSLKFGQGKHVTRSQVALAKEVEALKAIVKAQNAKIDAMESGKMAVGQTSTGNVNFPDVSENHWAYEYVKSLADRGLIVGYPDGEFKGDRSMTRYEFAAVIYRALQNGAAIDSKMAKAMGEFEPELNRIQELDRTRVDRISGKDNDRHKVERVRVNNKDNKKMNDYRDVYGGHVQPQKNTKTAKTEKAAKAVKTTKTK